jgi:hypothetical protein
MGSRRAAVHRVAGRAAREICAKVNASFAARSRKIPTALRGSLPAAHPAASTAFRLPPEAIVIRVVKFVHGSLIDLKGPEVWI